VVPRPLKRAASRSKSPAKPARRATRGAAKRTRAQPVVKTPERPDPERAAALLASRVSLPAAPRDDLAHRPFTLCTLNCNGLRSAERRGFVEWLARRRPDVLCLQEVRAWPEQVPAELRCPPGYNSRFVNGGKKGYAGVATYSRPAFDRHLEGIGLPWGDEEGRALRTDFGGVTVFNLYLPSGSSSPDRQILKFEFLAHLARHAKSLLKEGRPVIICGDLNIAHTELDIARPKANAKNSGFLPAEREWLGELLDAGWVDVLRTLHPDEPGHYSWWSNRGRARENDVGWRIDYVLASPDLAERAEEAWIEKRADLSDHAPVWVRFS
jgi:exodeoxyribonuclease-3